MFLRSAAPSSDHFLTDAKYRAQVEQDFQAKQKLLPQGNLFPSSTIRRFPWRSERRWHSFMRIFLSAILLTMTDRSICQNVRTSFEAQKRCLGEQDSRRYFPSFRAACSLSTMRIWIAAGWFLQKELKDRVKGMSLEQAALEVNHWCHEKVIYTPSDGRTSSPLASIKTAYGRCGEGIHIRCCCVAFGLHSCPSGLYSALGTPMTIMPGWKCGSTVNGISWAPANRLRFSIWPGSTVPFIAACWNIRRYSDVIPDRRRWCRRRPLTRKSMSPQLCTCGQSYGPRSR